MRFRLPCVCATAVAVCAGVATSAAATTAPPDSSPSSDPPAFDLHSPFWADATTKCTTVLNDHLDRSSGPLVSIEVLEADMSGDVPSADIIAGWTESLAADVARSEAIRAELADFVVTDAAYADLWDTIVAAADDGIEPQRARLTALETGDWETIVEAYDLSLGEAGGVSPEAFQAIDASPLRGTDCATVHQWRMPEDESVTPEFVTAVTEVCADVTNRRRSSTFADDYEASLQFLASVLGDDEPEIPAGLEAALGRIVDEWAVTVDDFAAIDATTAPSTESWDAIIAVPDERLAMFEARRDAVSSGDAAAIRDAYDASNRGAHPGWDWPAVGLDHRVCNGLQH